MGLTYINKIDRANTITVSRNVGGQFPLDCRCVIDSYTDLIVNFNNIFDDGTGTKNWYIGMIVYCVEKDKLYTLKKRSNIDQYSPTNPFHHEWVEVGGISQEDLSAITDSIAALNTSKLNNSSYLTKTDIYGILGFDQIIFSMAIDGTTYNTDATVTWNSTARITNFIGNDIDDNDVLEFDVYYSTDLEDEKKLEPLTNVTFSKFIVDNTNPSYIKFYIKKDPMKSNSIKISFNTTE